MTNQAIQVLQGPYITNTYGNQISCQGATFNATPYIQYSRSYKDPWEDYYLEPQYNNQDFTGRTTQQTEQLRTILGNLGTIIEFVLILMIHYMMSMKMVMQIDGGKMVQICKLKLM